jgi:hypothetical protein
MRDRRWRWLFSLSLLSIPGPCTTFDGDSASTPDAGDDGADASDAAPAPSGYLTLDEAVSVCSLVVRCQTMQYSIGISLAIGVDARDFSACIQTLAGLVPPSRRGFALQQGALKKVAAETECGNALAQLPVELLAQDPRCGTGRGCYTPTSAVECSDSGAGGELIGTLSRCAEGLGGPKCLAVQLPGDAGTAAVCAEGVCTSSTVTDYKCEGSVVHTCDPQYSTLEIKFDCAWVGLACGKGLKGIDTCVDPTSSDLCPGFGASDCSGDTARYCVAGESQQSWSRFACAEVGASCVGGRLIDGGGKPAICTPKNGECSPYAADIGACNGNVVSLCVDGKRMSYDCSKQGKQCDPGARGCQ